MPWTLLVRCAGRARQPSELPWRDRGRNGNCHRVVGQRPQDLELSRRMDSPAVVVSGRASVAWLRGWPMFSLCILLYLHIALVCVFVRVISTTTGAYRWWVLVEMWRQCERVQGCHFFSSKSGTGIICGVGGSWEKVKRRERYWNRSRLVGNLLL